MIKHTLTAFALLIGVSSLSALTEKERTFYETYGWIVGQQSGIAQLGLNEEEFKALIKGLEVARLAEEPPHNIQLLGPDMNTFLKEKAEANRPNYEKKMAATQARAEADAAEAAKENKKKGKAFMTELLASNDDIKKTTSGLYYEIIDEGDTSKKPSASDKVTVHYEGSLVDGTMFDSSRKRGQPSTFPLNAVIKGWTEGMQLIGEGGKLKLYVPSDLGYGDQGRPSIPPGALLIFDVELINVVKDEPKTTAVTPALGIEDAKKK